MKEVAGGKGEKTQWPPMMGAPEVTNLNAVLIRSLGAKKVIDVGVFTGASSLAAALALPDGENIFCLHTILHRVTVQQARVAAQQKIWEPSDMSSLHYFLH